MNKLHRTAGFTFVEIILAVGIMSVLAGFGFAAVHTYTRSMTKLQYDGYAKEIFVAAQNHLSMAASQGLVDKMVQGNPDNPDKHIYYFYFAPMKVDNSDNSVAKYPINFGSEDEYKKTLLSVMLPEYALDEAVLARGHFIIRYHFDSAQVLDVFYWENNGGRFSHNVLLDKIPDEYKKLLETEGNKGKLEDYLPDHSVIGYYGGYSGGYTNSPGVESLTRGTKLKPPSIVVKNAEKLTVEVTNPNKDGSKLKLNITGAVSRVPLRLDLTTVSNSFISYKDGKYTVSLDDITSEGGHFCDVTRTDPAYDYNNLIPGEDLIIQAVAYSDSVLTNVEYSSTQTVNSLFSAVRVPDPEHPEQFVAEISNIRHFENLGMDISGVNLDYFRTKVNIIGAVQISNMDWETFNKVIKDETSSDASVCTNKRTQSFIQTTQGTFLPVTPEYALAYDGQGHSISNINVKVINDSDAGLFGELKTINDTDKSSIKNLKLVDFKIYNQPTNNQSDGKSTGALAGSATKTEVTNVIAVNSRDRDKANAMKATITGKGSTGGLIGTTTDCTISKCAAALVVQSTGGNAGGLIGTATGSMTISACYSGGHTENAAYSSSLYNVTGTGDVGGLVGSFDGETIQYSYSTCSASTSGANVGGLVGSATFSDSERSLSNCYATGLVQGGSSTKTGAFAGTLSYTKAPEHCAYYEIVNEYAKDGDSNNGFEYLEALDSGSLTGISALDATWRSYDDFVSSTDRWGTAIPYDTTLNRYYKGKYPLRTVRRLGANVEETDLNNDGITDFVATHYGDWPAPEVWTRNEKTPSGG